MVYSSVADPGCLSRIPDLTFFHPESRIRIVSIPDPGSELFPSRIRIKEFKYFNPKKWFLSSRKYDPGCSSRIRVPDPDFLPIPDPRSRGQKVPDPGSATLVHRHWQITVTCMLYHTVHYTVNMFVHYIRS